MRFLRFTDLTDFSFIAAKFFSLISRIGRIIISASSRPIQRKRISQSGMLLSLSCRDTLLRVPARQYVYLFANNAITV